MKNYKQKAFNLLFDEIAVGTGFLTGLYTAIGFDPVGTLLNTCMQMTMTINSSPVFITAFEEIAVIPVILTIGAVLIAYIIGGLLGVMSIFIAYLSGLIIFHNAFLGFIFYLLSAGIAWVAVNMKEIREYTYASEY
jgi:hypothetical protein